MEQFFEEEVVVNTPLSKQLTTSTPCTKRKATSHTKFPSNITPVAVKQLFSLNSGVHLSEFTWTSSLATGFHSEDSDLNSHQMFSPDKNNHLHQQSSDPGVSMSLFSSWLEDENTEAGEKMGPSEASNMTSLSPPQRGKLQDSLSELLKTPPSLKMKKTTAPRKRSASSPSHDLLKEIMNIKKNKLLCSSKIEDETLAVKLDCDVSNASPSDSLDVVDSAFHVSSNLEPSPATPSNCTLAASVGKLHRSAFKHTSRSVQKPSKSSQDFKPVRPSSATKGGFFYPTSQINVKTNDCVTSSPEKENQETFKMRPRRLAKFAAPYKLGTCQQSVADSDNKIESSRVTESDSGFTSPTLLSHAPQLADAMVELTGLAMNSDVSSKLGSEKPSNQKSLSVVAAKRVVETPPTETSHNSLPNGQPDMTSANCCITSSPKSSHTLPVQPLPSNHLVADLLNKFCNTSNSNRGNPNGCTVNMPFSNSSKLIKDSELKKIQGEKFCAKSTMLNSQDVKTLKASCKGALPRLSDGKCNTAESNPDLAIELASNSHCHHFAASPALLQVDESSAKVSKIDVSTIDWKAAGKASVSPRNFHLQSVPKDTQQANECVERQGVAYTEINLDVTNSVSDCIISNGTKTSSVGLATGIDSHLKFDASFSDPPNESVEALSEKEDESISIQSNKVQKNLSEAQYAARVPDSVVNSDTEPEEKLLQKVPVLSPDYHCLSSHNTQQQSVSSKFAEAVPKEPVTFHDGFSSTSGKSTTSVHCLQKENKNFGYVESNEVGQLLGTNTSFTTANTSMTQFKNHIRIAFDNSIATDKTTKIDDLSVEKNQNETRVRFAKDSFDELVHAPLYNSSDMEHRTIQSADSCSFQNQQKANTPFEVGELGPKSAGTSSNYSADVGSEVPAVGFTTAGGKKISVSRNSLDKIKNLFEPVMATLDTIQPVSPDKPSQAPTLRITNSACYNASSDKGGLPMVVPPKFKNSFSVGFHTAGGKKIDISETSLLAAKQIFESSQSTSDEKRCLEISSKVVTNKPMIGFTTARGTSINVSASSVEAVKHLFEENPVVESAQSLPKDTSIRDKAFPIKTSKSRSIQVNENNKSGLVSGFTTGLGKAIEVSDNSLKVAKKLLEESDLEDKNFDMNQEGICLSDTEISNCCNQSVNGAFNVQTQKPCNQVGFGKVCKAELESSRASFSSVNNSFGESNIVRSAISNSSTSLSTFPVTFATANGKKVKISKSSFQAVQHLFDSENSQNCQQQVLAKPKDYPISFTTARGSAVDISSSSLLHAKSLFDESSSEVHRYSSVSGEIQHRNSNSDTMGRKEKVPTSPKSSDHIAPVCTSEVFDTYPQSTALQLSVISQPTDVDNIHSCQKVPDLSSPLPNPSLADTLKNCVTPPVRRRSGSFRSQSPLCVTPNGFMRNRSFAQKAYWTTPNSSGKKFSYGNRPFKPHTPDRQALARKAAMSSGGSDSPAQTISIPECGLAERGTSGRRVFTAETKPANLRKPTKLMISQKERCERITLEALGPPRQNSSSLTRKKVANVTSHSASSYIFHDVTDEQRGSIQALCTECDITEHLTSSLSSDQLYNCFQMMVGVDPSLLTREWFNNHYKWIVWKLASLERSYVDRYEGVCNPVALLHQMKYRYEREVDLSQRSALRKIYERDDISSKTMVLVVSSIHATPPIDDDHNTEQSSSTMELSDGWYAVRVSYDTEMKEIIDRGSIKEGCKLVVAGAQRLGPDEACSPLTARASDVCLKIFTNSVRRAAYHTRLGFTSNKLVMSLSSLLPLGGIVPCLKLLISTVYPLVYMEKTESGTVFRNEVKERQVAQEDADKRNKLLEQELNKENGQQSRIGINCKKRRYAEKEIKQATSGEELMSMIEDAVDPILVQEMMTEWQRERLYVHQQQVASERAANIRKKVRGLLPAERSVTPMLKVRVSSLHAIDKEKQAWTILTLWRPTYDMLTMLKEGCVFNIYNLAASHLRGQKAKAPVLLSANKHTRFERLTVDKSVIGDIYTPREVLSLAQVTKKILDTEIVELDTAGIVVGWETPNSSITVVYVASPSAEILSLNFWGGLKVHGYDKLVKEGSLLHCSNLQKSSKPFRYSLPNLTVSETSSISTGYLSVHNSAYAKELSSLCQKKRLELVRHCQNRLLQLARSSTSTQKQSDISCGNHKEDFLSLALSSQSSFYPSLTVSAKSRRALERQYQSPIRKRSSTAIPCAPKTKVKQAPEESEDEVSDSQLLACFSQS